MPMTDANIAHQAPPVDLALPIGTALSGNQFTITEQLGAGGFGITYKAMDNVLGRTIVIKECFPEDFCARDGKNVVARSSNHAKPVRSIVKMFMREARSLAKLRHPNIVGVHRAFEENQTAYMVLDLIDGRDLFDILETQSPKLSPARVKDILFQLLDAIETVHDAGLLHRDISPDNIIIEKSGKPVLIDFGAARGDASRHTRAVSSLLVVKDGYSPQEFYVAGSEQLPCSDLYALAATFYNVLSGKPPINSQSRLVEIAGKKPDPCVPLVGNVEGYDEAFLRAIDTAMQIHPNDRLQSATKWRAMISDVANEGPGTAAPSSRPMVQDISLELEQSLTKLVEETNDVVRMTSQIPEEPAPAPTAPEKPSKPAWIEEFNQETLAPPPEPQDADDDTHDADWVDTAHDLEANENDVEDSAVSSAPRGRSDTNWIGRAHEKQERIRSAQEAIYGIGDPGERVRAAVETADNAPVEMAGDMAPEGEKRGWFGPIGFVIGVSICLYFIFYFPAS